MNIYVTVIVILISTYIVNASLLDPVVENVVHLQASKPPSAVPGIWKKKTIWKPRWIKEWKSAKVMKPVWRKVWSPVQIREWVPIPKPPPGWENISTPLIPVKAIPFKPIPPQDDGAPLWDPVPYPQSQQPPPPPQNFDNNECVNGQCGHVSFNHQQISEIIGPNRYRKAPEYSAFSESMTHLTRVPPNANWRLPRQSFSNFQGIQNQNNNLPQLSPFLVPPKFQAFRQNDVNFRFRNNNKQNQNQQNFNFRLNNNGQNFNGNRPNGNFHVNQNNRPNGNFHVNQNNRPNSNIQFNNNLNSRINNNRRPNGNNQVNNNRPNVQIDHSPGTELKPVQNQSPFQWSPLNNNVKTVQHPYKFHIPNDVKQQQNGTSQHIGQENHKPEVQVNQVRPQVVGDFIQQAQLVGEYHYSELNFVRNGTEPVQHPHPQLPQQQNRHEQHPEQQNPHSLQQNQQQRPHKNEQEQHQQQQQKTYQNHQQQQYEQQNLQQQKQQAHQNHHQQHYEQQNLQQQKQQAHQNHHQHHNNQQNLQQQKEQQAHRDHQQQHHQKQQQQKQQSHQKNQQHQQPSQQQQLQHQQQRPQQQPPELVPQRAQNQQNQQRPQQQQRPKQEQTKQELIKFKPLPPRTPLEQENALKAGLLQVQGLPLNHAPGGEGKLRQIRKDHKQNNNNQQQSKNIFQYYLNPPKPNSNLEQTNPETNPIYKSTSNTNQNTNTNPSNHGFAEPNPIYKPDNSITSSTLSNENLSNEITSVPDNITYKQDPVTGQNLQVVYPENQTISSETFPQLSASDILSKIKLKYYNITESYQSTTQDSTTTVSVTSSSYSDNTETVTKSPVFIVTPVYTVSHS